MKVVISGGNGQLGRAFAAIWPEAMVIDRSELDLTASRDEIIAVVKKYNPEVFINCGAYTAVDQAEVEADLAMQINGSAVAAITEACKDLKAWLIQISTDYVLAPDPPSGSTVRRADEQPAPANQYGRSKLKGEEAVLNYERGRVIRTSWVFGEGKNFVKTMYQLGQTKDELSVVSDQIGRPTYATDLAVAIKSLIEHGLEAVPSILHIQNEGQIVSWADFARAIMQASGSQTRIKDVSTAEFSAGKTPFAIRPSSSVFDLEPLHKLAVGMPDWQSSLDQYVTSLKTQA